MDDHTLSAEQRRRLGEARDGILGDVGGGGQRKYMTVIGEQRGTINARRDHKGLKSI